MNDITMKQDTRPHEGVIVGEDFGIFDPDTSRVIPHDGDGSSGHDPNIEPSVFEAASTGDLSVDQVAGHADEYTDGQGVIATANDPVSAIRFAVQEMPDDRVGDFLHALHRVLYAKYEDDVLPPDAVELSVTKQPGGIPDEARGPVSDTSQIPDDAVTISGPRGGTYWIPADEVPDDADLPDDAIGPGDDDGETPGAEEAEPSELAGGVAAAIDDDRDDFHDIRNAIVGADSREEAQAIIEENLSEDEIDALAEEVERQQEMRENFDVVDDPGNLRFGQEVLYDADRPKRGVVEDIDADGTVWINNAHRETGGGVNADFGTIYADPDYEGVGGDEPFTAEPGRHGLASNPEVLENAFEAADEVKGSREAGIQGGNTTGDKMKILEQDDGSRVFATPLNAYPGTTGVVRGPREARDNNLNSPKVIDALGGGAAKTRITEGPSGDEYIAKEGIEGQEVSEYTQRGGSATDAVKESAQTTHAAAYFVGNVDLHGGNMVVDTDTGDVVVIDHDSAGKIQDRRGFKEVVPDTTRFTSGPRGLGMDSQETQEEIYEMAQDIRSGEVDLSGAARHSQEFAEEAADKAVRQAYVDPSYDLPEDQVPAETQFPPSGIETIDDFDDPNDNPDDFYHITFVDGSGDVVSGTVEDVDGGELMVDGESGFDDISDPNRVVEIL